MFISKALKVVFQAFLPLLSVLVMAVANDYYLFICFIQLRATDFFRYSLKKYDDDDIVCDFNPE